MSIRRTVRTYIFVLITLLTGLALSGCDKDTSNSAPQNAAPPPPAVTVMLPVEKDVTDWDEFTGRLYPVESVEIRARVSGYLNEVSFVEGALINKGDLLYVIDPRPYQTTLEQAVAEKDRATSALELAENDLSRAERLFKTKAISEEVFDSRQKQKQIAAATLQAARAAVDAAKLDLEFTRVKAPISGRISRTNVTVGNLIKGGNAESTLLTNIVSLDPIYVYFTADEQSVLHYTRMDLSGERVSSRVKANPVFLKLADEDEYIHEGRMDFVDNQIDLATGTMRGRAIVENPTLLLVPGMFADVKLLGEGPYKALLIPDRAINIDQTIRFVYVVDENNVVARKQIHPGRIFEGLRVIRSGIEASDRIVIDGLQRVRAGMTVSPEMAKNEAENAESQSE